MELVWAVYDIILECHGLDAPTHEAPLNVVEGPRPPEGVVIRVYLERGAFDVVLDGENGPYHRVTFILPCRVVPLILV